MTEPIEPIVFEMKWVEFRTFRLGHHPCPVCEKNYSGFSCNPNNRKPKGDVFTCPDGHQWVEKCSRHDHYWRKKIAYKLRRAWWKIRPWGRHHDPVPIGFG